jgi:transcriptional regulator with XRE-family HTH domain
MGFCMRRNFEMPDLQQSLGAVIRRARRERGLTLKELAERAALSEIYMREIEHGKKYPSARVLESIADAMDLDLADMLDLLVQEMRAETILAPAQPIGFAPPRQPAGNEPQMSVMSPATVAVIALAPYLADEASPLMPRIVLAMR